MFDLLVIVLGFRLVFGFEFGFLSSVRELLVYDLGLGGFDTVQAFCNFVLAWACVLATLLFGF